MSSDIIEIGRELQAVKRRLEHGRFLNWVEAECNLPRRSAQLMMAAAEWAQGKNEIVSLLEPTAIYALAAPSTPETVRQDVLSLLKEGQTPAPKAVRDMIRAVKKRKPTAREKNSRADNNARKVAQTDAVQPAGIGRRDPQPGSVQSENGQAPSSLLADAGAETESLWPEAGLEETARSQGGSRQGNDPRVDPFRDEIPRWINGALQLISLLIKAIPLETVPNRDAIIRGALQLIPPLVEAVLELRDIQDQPEITGLLKYCAYNAYADRVALHSTAIEAAVAEIEQMEATDAR